VVGVVCSYYPFLALLVSEGASPVDCFRLPNDPEQAFALFKTEQGLKELSTLIRKQIRRVDWRRFDAQLEAIQRHGVRVATYRDSHFPKYLSEIPKSPAVLFYQGDLGLLRRQGVAIVGSRVATARGCRFAGILASDLAARGITISSGLARGIDTAAHRGALEAEGSTCAFVGTGLDVVYPSENKGLAQTLGSDGCIVTEQLMGMKPRGFVFPLRNRLISAVSHIVIVVEAAARSGAIVTANWARDQGRTVAAVPGFPGDPRSRGTNRLIKAGAFAIESVADVFEAAPALAQQCEGGPASHRGIQSPPPLSEEAADVFHAVGSSSTDPDELAEHLNMHVSEVQRVLLELEMQRLVARDATGGYHKA